MLVDFRAVEGAPAATQKTLYALSIEEQYREHLATGGLAFGVAYLGSTPSVSTYEPGLELTKSQDLPFDIFTDENEAYKWLDIESPDKAK